MYGSKRIGSFVSVSNVKNTIGKALQAEMQTGRSAVIRVIRAVWLKANKFARAVKTGKQPFGMSRNRAKKSRFTKPQDLSWEYFVTGCFCPVYFQQWKQICAARVVYLDSVTSSSAPLPFDMQCDWFHFQMTIFPVFVFNQSLYFCLTFQWILMTYAY